MRQHMSNKEEAEWLKQWWKDYGQGILLAVIIGLALSFGWRYWRGERQQKNFQASSIYQQTQATSSSTAAGVLLAQQALAKKFPKTIYGQLNSLQMANGYVAKKKYSAALKVLANVSAQPKLPALGQLALLKTAQIQNQLNQPHKALSTLKTVVDSSFQPMIDYQKSNAYALLKDSVNNKLYLNKAIAGYKNLKLDTSLLRLNAGLQ